MDINVIIITRNRAAFLNRCLASLTHQTVVPREIIIVDNNSTDNTQSVITKYKGLLPIQSIQEPQIGIPYARNAALAIAHSDIIAFLDDDCIACSSWLSTIRNSFHKLPSAVGFIGYTMAANKQSVSALVEFTYNLRWVLLHVMNTHTISNITSGVVIDFKNAAFRRDFIKQFVFSTNTLFGDVGNEDSELGYRMFQKNQHIFFNPSMKASHLYSQSLSRLVRRNFWSGYADMLLLLQNGVDLNGDAIKPKTRVWISLCLKISKNLSLYKKLIFYLFMLMYPLASRTGRLVAALSWVFKLPVLIPKR